MMSRADRASISCGVLEIYQLSSLEEFLRAYKRYYVKLNYVIFSDRSDLPNRGEGIAKELKSRKLGRVFAMPQQYNPSSGNRIKLWVWIPSTKFKRTGK